MKIYNIFKKDLKTVSRNWNYFVVLFIFPGFLILVSGIMLSSVDYGNIKIGVFQEGESSGINLNSNNLLEYTSFPRCLNDVKNSKISMCMDIQTFNKSTQITAYVDNSKPVIEYYLKQFVLSDLLKGQANKIHQSVEELSGKITVYYTSLKKAKTELQGVYQELDNQEKILRNYKKNLTEVRNEFNEVYVPLKENQDRINNLTKELNQSQKNIDDNITEIRKNIVSMKLQLNNLKSFLNGKISNDDFSQVSLMIDEILDNLNVLESNLDNLEDIAEQEREMVSILSQLGDIMEKLDKTNALLNQLDNNLDYSIQKNKENKEKVRKFIEKLDETSKDINEFKNEKSKEKGIGINFKHIIQDLSSPTLKAFPLIVALIITFTSLIISNMFILKKINDSSYFRDLVSPTRDTTFLISDYLINLFFISIQIGVLYLIGKYWFNIPSESLKIFVLILFISASIFILLGMGIGYLVKTQSLSMLLTIFFVIFILIFSDILSPPILMKPVVRFLIKMNPFFILKSALYDILIFGKSFYSIVPFFQKSIVYLFLSWIFVYISKKINKMKFKD